MAKKGMARPDVTHTKPKNEQAAVPEIQGKAKKTKESANPIIAGTNAPGMKVYHTNPYNVDNDLARDNIDNDLDMTEADKQDQ